jgi:hypothetical protein
LFLILVILGELKMTEPCARCKEVDEDRRTLWMACFYEMDELGLPFEKQTMINPDAHEWNKKQNFYLMRVCKQSRADWMAAIKKWFHDYVPREQESCGSGIFVMRNGVPVEVTLDEWEELQANRQKEVQ